MRAEETPSFKVGYLVDNAPFSMQKDGKPHGFLIDLWEQMAAQNNWSFTYAPINKTHKDNIDDVFTQEAADILLGSFPLKPSVSHQFSQAYFALEAGVAVNKQAYSFWDLFFSNLSSIAIFIAIITIVCAFIMGFVVHYMEYDITPQFRDKSFFKSYWLNLWSFFCIGTGIDVVYPINAMRSRLIVGLWIIVTMFFFTVFSGIISSSLTVASMLSHYKNPWALKDKLVAVPKTSSYGPLVAHFDAFIYPTTNLDMAFKFLREEKVDVVVDDFIGIDAYIKAHPQQPYRMTSIRLVNYLLALPVKRDSPLLHSLNRALNQAQQEGTFYTMCLTHFGAEGAKQCLL